MRFINFLWWLKQNKNNTTAWHPRQWCLKCRRLRPKCKWGFHALLSPEVLISGDPCESHTQTVNSQSNHCEIYTQNNVFRNMQINHKWILKKFQGSRRKSRKDKHENCNQRKEIFKNKMADLSDSILMIIFNVQIHQSRQRFFSPLFWASVVWCVHI